MDNEKNYYSLGQVIVNYHPNGEYYKILRLADFLGDDIAVPARKFYAETTMWDLSEIKMINKAPKSYGGENQLGIWKWYSKDGKQYSQPVGSRFYELIHHQSLSSEFLSLPDLLDVLSSGISKPAFDVHPPFLLTIKETDTQYVCLEIENDAISITQDKIRLLEGRKVNIYSLPKTEFISSDTAFKRLTSWDQKTFSYIPRTVYLRYPLPEKGKITTIEVHPFSTCLDTYLTHSLGKVSDSEGKKSVIKDVLDSGEFTDENFEKFIKVYLNTDADIFLSEFIVKYKVILDRLKEYAAGNTKEKNFFKVLIENIPELKEEYSKVLLTDYIDEAKAQALESISDVTGELQSLRSEKEQLEETVQNLTGSKTHLDEENTTLQEINDKIRKSLSINTLEIFSSINNLKELLSLDIFNTSSRPQTQQSDAQPIIKRPVSPITPTDDFETINTLTELVDTIEDNLSSNGFSDSRNLAKLIASSYVYHVPIACVGYASNLLTDIITLSVAAEKAETFCFPTGYHDYQALLSTIRKADSEYVILENILGSSEEYCYLHLSEDIPEKRIIFTIDFKDTLKIIPTEIYSHIFFIDADRYYQGLDNKAEIFYGKVSSLDNLPEPNKEVSSKNLFALRKVLTNSPISASYVYLRSKMLNLFPPEEKGDISLVYPELASILILIGYSDEYSDYLEDDKSLSAFGKYLDAE